MKKLFTLPQVEVLTASKLELYQREFEDHFKFETPLQKALIPVRNSEVRVSWQEVLDAQGSVQLGAEDLYGIHLGYGLSDGHFVPTIEFLELIDEVPTVRGKPFISTSAGLKDIEESERAALADNYVQQIRIRRSAGPTFEKLTSSDIIGTTFFWAGKLKDLLDANPIIETRQLVISCICAEVRKDSTVIHENAHLVALHIAKLHEIFGHHHHIDQLSDEVVSGQPMLALRAMDYGSLCPENCPRR